MTRREQLWENYEEAVFALLMDEVAEEEGKKLLEENERLKQDPSAAIPPEVDRRCRATIRRAFARERRSRAALRSWRILRRLCVAVVLCAILLATAFAAFPQFRINALNLLIQIGDVATTFRMVEDTPSSDSETAGIDEVDNSPSVDDSLFGYTLPDIPEGFTETFRSESDLKISIEFTNQDNDIIYFSLLKELGGGKYNVDTENAQRIENIEIHGFDGLLIEKGNELRIVWGDTEQSIYIMIYGIGVDQDTLMALANGFSQEQ